jgi:hypothetical protein
MLSCRVSRQQNSYLDPADIPDITRFQASNCNKKYGWGSSTNKRRSIQHEQPHHVLLDRNGQPSAQAKWHSFSPGLENIALGCSFCRQYASLKFTSLCRAENTHYSTCSILKIMLMRCTAVTMSALLHFTGIHLSGCYWLEVRVTIRYKLIFSNGAASELAG